MNASHIQKEEYLKEALNCFELACVHAQAGNLQISATSILEGLNQERKAGAVGPQVLQLIKPRNL